MGVTTTNNKPFNPRGNDQSPKGYNRAKLYSGKALDFDGVNDYANVVYSDTIGSVWTWSSIIEADALSGYQVLFGGTYGANNGVIVLKGSELNIYTNTDNLFSYTLETGKKYHVALSQSGSSVSAFINGVLVDSVSLSVTLDAGGGSYYIGRNPNSAIEFFNGKLSGVKLFNTALTAAQVADLYNNPEKVVPTGLESNLKLWLPMMEGAGTTAYDGSGNGNHGTISGATYVNGIGAPVAQSAVISWNKGSNLVTYSEQFDNAAWVKSNSSVTANTAVSPSGNTDADLITSSGSEGQIYQTKTLNGTHTISVFFKAGTSVLARLQFYDNGAGTSAIGLYNLTTLSVSATGLSSTGTITSYGNDWYRCTLTANLSGSAVLCFLGINENAKNILAWGGQVNAGSVGPYVRTGTTAQTSEVLLPQGLTTGRDLLGNLFENVRKQGALNLDGKSWGKVHPNNSFAFGTGAFSLEAWAKLEYLQTGSYANEIICLNDVDEFAIKTISAGTSFSAGSGVSISHTITLDNSWAHIVGVKNANGSMKLYINGVEKVSNSAGSSTASVPVTNPVRLGADNTELSRAYKDQIAQPRIYNRALTAEEVQRNYNAGKNTYTN